MPPAHKLGTRIQAGHRRRLVVRTGLVLLAVGQGSGAAWALLAPRGFYDGFPGGGQHWVAALPPYNEHLVRDYGASFLALSVLALAAAAIAERRLVLVALAVWLVAALPHLEFHLVDGGGGAGASITALILDAAVPLILIALVPKEANP